MRTAIFRNDIIDLVMKHRGLAPRHVYNAAPTSESIKQSHRPGAISKATFSRIMDPKNRRAAPRFAVTIARRLGVYEPKWLLDPDTVPLKEVEHYIYESYNLDYENPILASPTASRQPEQFDSPELPLPSAAEMNDLGSALVGRWWMHHLSRDGNGKTKLSISIIKIRRSGSCELLYENHTFKLRYEGIIYFENHDRFLLILDSKTQRIPERIVFRFDYPMHDIHTILQGSWLGVDQGFNICGSRTILSHEKLNHAEAQAALSELDSSWVSSTDLKRSETQADLFDTWREDLILDSVAKCRSSDTINILCIYLPEDRRLLKTIKQKGRRLSKRKSRNGRLSIRILFLDYRPSRESKQPREVLKARFRHFNMSQLSEKQAKKTGAKKFAYFQNQIRSQVQTYLNLSKNFKDDIDLKVMLYESWAFSQYFKIGNQAIYQGFITTEDSAIHGPMLRLSDPKSDIWEHFENNFNATLRNACDAAKLSSDELGFPNPFED